MKQKSIDDKSHKAKLFSDFIIECQFIEEYLRNIILLCGNEISLSLNNKKSKVSYNIAKKELEDLPMKALISRLNRFNLDGKLIKKLDLLRRMRNKIVHKEYISKNKNLGVLGLIRALKYSEECYDDLDNLIINVFENKK